MKNKTLNIKGCQISLTVAIFIISTTAALLSEVFFFNRAHFRILGENIVNPKVYLDDGTEFHYYEYYSFSEGFSLTIPNINQKVTNYYLDIGDYGKNDWGENDSERLEAFHVRTFITDEGNANSYCFDELLVCPKVNSSMYIPIEAYGNVKDLKIYFKENVDEFFLDGIVLNERPPLRINLLRIVIISLAIIALCTIFLNPYNMEISAQGNRKRLIALLVTATILAFLATSIQRQNLMHGMAKGYPELARSFAEGRVYIEENADEVLRNLDNPYDRIQRDKLGACYYWDVAYYNDKYYIYFGAVPVILFHLPYYLVTGQDLNYTNAQIVMNILILLGALALIEEIRKKFFPTCPISLEVLIYITFIFAVGLGILVKRSGVYYEAIGTAIMLVLWGLFLWLHSVKQEGVCLWQGMLGSLLMAAAVGSRPQFAIVSFAAFYIFRQIFRDKNLKSIVLLILPYVPVAIVLMAYNYLRFGSVVDFGANYNLTTHDMTHIGIHLSRIPMGIWYYLIKTPIFDYTFPYMRNDSVAAGYQGFIAWESQAGGAIALTPYLFLGISALKDKSDEGKLFKISIIATLITVFADSLMCGISMRYQLDFRIILALPVVIFNIKRMGCLNDSKDVTSINKYFHITALLCVLTIALGILTFLCQYEVIDYSYIDTNPVFYCKLRAMFGG